MENIRDSAMSSTLQKIRTMMGNWSLSSDLQEEIPGFRTQKGIYKPQNYDYALWIRQTLKGPYPDKEPKILPDGSWYYLYTPEADSTGETNLSLSTNRALINSMDDHIPVGVFIQRELPKTRSTYEVMGLAYVEQFDGKHFVIHGEPIDIEAEPLMIQTEYPFVAHEETETRISESMRVVRRKAFQLGIRKLYHEKCSLCELGYHFRGQPIGVEAAHVIPVSEKGTSKDLRNGILLCQNHHTLFDRNLWAFDEDFRVHVKDDPIFRRSAEKNHILKIEGLRLPNLPDNEFDMPAREAIDYRLNQFYG